MNENLNFKTILPIGLMLFSFFFGAGNLIFPPVLGQMAGNNILPAIIGFCISGVGLPLLGVLAMAIRRSDKPEELARPVSKWYANTVIVLCALTIGPFFAIPRTAAVSFETGIATFLPPEASVIGMAVYSLCFFGITYYLSMNPSRIIDSIGKVMSPLLLICLFILLACVFVNPPGSMQEPNSTYVTAPFFAGFQQGYNTMDLLCALLFGAVTIQTIRMQGITDYKNITRICIYAGCIAAFCLAVIYASLGFMGALSRETFGIVANGAQLLNLVAVHYMGMPGQLVLAVIIFFACLTTSIGLTSSIATNLSEMADHKVQYQNLVTVMTLFSLLISNFGLTNIIKFSVPVICMLYPIIIGIVMLNLGEPLFKSSYIIFRCCLIPTSIFALGDGLRAAGVMPTTVDAVLEQYLPLFDVGFGWVLPCFGGMALGLLLEKLMPRRG